MKILGAIGTIISGVILLLITQMLADKPDLRFSLTAPISTSMLDGQNNEYLQELSIKNIGKEEAKKISINIEGTKIYYELKKYSNADVIKEFKKDGSIEIAYDSLPPAGEIKIILRASSKINGNSVNIYHSKGVARDIFSKSTFEIFAGTIFYLLLNMVVVLIIFIQVYYTVKESSAKYDGEALLCKRKPFLLTDKKWDELVYKALEHSSETYHIDTVEQLKATLCYRYLDGNTKVNIGESKTASFTLKAEKKLVEHISKMSTHTYDFNSIDRLISLKKPEKMSDSAWEEVIKVLHGRYVDLYLSKLYLDFKKDLPENALTKPDFLTTKYWNELKAKIEMILVANIANKICNSYRYDIEDFDISGLSDENQSKLYKLSYAQKLMQIPPIDSIDTANELIASISNGELSWLTESDATKINRCAQKIVEILTREGELKEKTKEVNAVSLEIIPLKEKICQQLHIVDILLNRDPQIMDKIEEYAMPFSKGNAQNLRRVGLMLKCDVGKGDMGIQKEGKFSSV